MDQATKSTLNSLRAMSSKEAADWLMARYPAGSETDGEAMLIAAHLSWKTADQLRLADYYLSKLPLAIGRSYKTFASFMPIYRLVEILRKHAPSDERGKDLFQYYAVPVLKKSAKTEKDHQAVQSFLAELREK